MSGFAGDASSDAAPQWFADAIGQAPLIKRLTTADGTTINYRVWGERAWPGVLLVHGAAASAAWWDHIAPQLSGHRVVAVDLSGHGDSSHKSGGYPVGEWAAEVAAVAIAEKLDRPVLVGHSLGGRVAVHAAVAEPELFSRVVLIDTPARHSTVVRLTDHRVYPDPTAAIRRFRPLPAQAVVLDYLREHIVRHSLRPVSGGWMWKFDPRIFSPRPPLAEVLPKLTTPAALVRCEHGMVPRDMADEMAGMAGTTMPIIQIPDAGHHPMLDRPIALTEVLRRLVTTANSERHP